MDGKRLSRSAIGKIFRRNKYNAIIEKRYGKRATAHPDRHTFASYYLYNRRNRIDFSDNQSFVGSNPVRKGYQRLIFNGNIGVVKRVPDYAKRDLGEEDLKLEVHFDEEKHIFTPDEFINIEKAYGITVHKLQGSSTKRVIIPIPNKTHQIRHLIDRTLLYTAVTRAEEQVVFIGDYKTFKDGVLKESNVERRQSGANFLLII